MFRFGYLEDSLNKATSNATNDISAEDIVTDIIRALYARRPEASEVDCLLSGCQDLTEDGSDGLVTTEAWSLETSGEDRGDSEEQCKHVNCVDFAEFKRFFKTVEPLIGESLSIKKNVCCLMHEIDAKR